MLSGLSMPSLISGYFLNAREYRVTDPVLEQGEMGVYVATNTCIFMIVVSG